MAAKPGRRRLLRRVPRSKPDVRQLPELAKLHERHRALTPAVCGAYAEAAAVCLSRHHTPPANMRIQSPESNSTRPITWPVPDTRVLAAWANHDDATRDGAYAVAIAATETELQLLATSRAETRTGADYYVSIGSEPDLETDQRLEISGIDNDTPASLARRLAAKQQQAADGKSALPAIAAVVGFRSCEVRLARVNDDG